MSGIYADGDDGDSVAFLPQGCLPTLGTCFINMAKSEMADDTCGNFAQSSVLISGPETVEMLIWLVEGKSLAGRSHLLGLLPHVKVLQLPSEFGTYQNPTESESVVSSLRNGHVAGWE